MGLKIHSTMQSCVNMSKNNYIAMTFRWLGMKKSIKAPDFKALDDSIASLSIQYGKKLLDGDTSAVDALKKDLAELRNRKIHLLKSAGFPEDYLEPVYDCPDCKDTGYIGNQKCHCFKKAIIGLLYDQSNIKNSL